MSVIRRASAHYFVFIASASKEALVQTSQIIPCSHTQSMYVDEGLDKNIDLYTSWVLQHGRL